MKKPVYVSKGFGFFVLSVIFLWAVCGWILLSNRTSTATCHQNFRNDKTLTINGYKLQAQTARTSVDQENGLSGRSCIAQNQAMLFVFDKPGYYPFWMKNMKFKLDIAWLSADKQVVDIQKNLAPSTYPNSFMNAQPAKYVIELQAGRADSLDLQSGTTVKF